MVLYQSQLKWKVYCVIQESTNDLHAVKKKKTAKLRNVL